MPPPLSARDKRLRLTRLALRDFRAFPGPADTVIDFSNGNKAGRNLLLYGENGSGKSSVFEALRGLFNRRPSATLFRDERNVFSGQAEADARVTAAFTDDLAPAVWSVAAHPGRAGGDPRVRKVALSAAMLDYRALLDTNYGQGRGEPNLFEIAVRTLLRGYPVPAGDTLGELWDAIKPSMPFTRYSGRAAVDAACAAFNAEFAAAVAAALPFTRSVLGDLLQNGLVLDALSHGSVRYQDAHQWRDRKIVDRLLRPVVHFRAHPLKHPQFFLNEARQSALALAIYLGARLACTQALPDTAPKLLVLDDVLIGIDQSNRLPVLDVLMKHFADWQIVLLTHDRLWFDIARLHLRPADDWAYLELHEAATRASTSMPTVRRVGASAADTALDQAESFCADGHVAAAATYARTAFELGLRQWAEKGSVPVRFRQDPGDVSTQDLIDAIRRAKAPDANGDAAKALRAVEMFRTAVLSPMSHATPPNIVKSEVQGAIAAVRFMLAVAKQSARGNA